MLDGTRDLINPFLNEPQKEYVRIVWVFSFLSHRFSQTLEREIERQLASMAASLSQCNATVRQSARFVELNAFAYTI